MILPVHSHVKPLKPGPFRKTALPTALNSTAASSPHTPANQQAPYWAGRSGPISQAINAAIANPAIWSVMRMGARNAMVKTAEKAGIPWKQTVAELQACNELEQLRVELTDPDLVYPGYAERKFHAYDGGNLDWLAVWEVEPATAATAVRILRPDTMAPEEATTTMRQSFIHSVQAFCRRHSVEVHQAVDAGCAGGESTRWLADSFPEARVTGVDISAHFLALAELRRRQAEPSSPAAGVSYIHAGAESLPMEDSSLDLVAGSYLLHELPSVATCELLQEAHRVLRPGGMVAVIDGDPGSDVHQKMPLPLATLMKATEPYLDEYFSLDLKAAMQAAGFKDVECLPVNRRHRVTVGRT